MCEVEGGFQADALLRAEWWRLCPRQSYTRRRRSNISFPKSNIDIPVVLDKDLQTQMSKMAAGERCVERMRELVGKADRVINYS